MIHTISEIIIIALLAIVGLFHSKAPVFLIMAASVLIILIAYRSVCEEEKDSRMAVVSCMAVFAILSGNFAGFLVFFFLKAAKVSVRAGIGTLLFVFVQLAIYRNMPIAMCILFTIFLVLSFLLLNFLYSMAEQAEKRKWKENERVIASNISELHEKRLNKQLVMQKYMDEKNARLLERENISRNIHNSVGHSITAAIMTLDAADMLYDVKPEEARKKMRAANNRIRDSLASIRRAVRVLDDENAELTAGELKAELDMIITDFAMDTGVEIYQNDKEMEDDIKLPHDYVVFLAGVLQEALTNGVKHGNASEFVVALLGDSAHVKLMVSDNGHSDFSALNCKQRIENGFGIKKMMAYAEKCGGKTKLENQNGFRLVVELPVGFGE